MTESELPVERFGPAWIWIADLTGNSPPALTAADWDTAGFEYLTSACWDAFGPYASVQSRNLRSVYTPQRRTARRFLLGNQSPVSAKRVCPAHGLISIQKCPQSAPAQARSPVGRSKTTHDLEPPYGVEP